MSELEHQHQATVVRRRAKAMGRELAVRLKDVVLTDVPPDFHELLDQADEAAAAFPRDASQAA